MKSKNKRYVADFETTSANFYKENGYAKVWLYAICNENGEIVCHGDSIEKFFENIKDLGSSTIYFHNLKFDGSYILNYLLNSDYKFKKDNKAGDTKTYSTLIGELGEFYQIKVVINSKVIITFNDSLKIIPLKVKEIAKSFNLPIEKEVIDYEKYEINDTTLSYVYKDVQIVAMALKYFKDKGLNKMTIGSNSYNQYISESKYKGVFVALDKKWCEDYRAAYRGGRSQVNPKYANKILEGVKRFDINSMYPSIMVNEFLPYGSPIKCKVTGNFKFELYKVEISFSLKNNHLPSLLKKGALFDSIGDTYYTKTEGVEVLYISNIDLELVYRNYNVHYIKYIEIWGFNTTKLLFKDYILKYYDLKSKSTGGMRLVYKLLINSLYGKFGSKQEGYTKVPLLNDKKELIYKNSDVEEMKQYYLPIAIAITSYAHKMLDDSINYDKDNFVYCDTDSIHTLTSVEPSKIDNKELGKFKLEGVEEKSKYVRQKCYVYKENDKYNITCSGMTEELKEYLNREYGDKIFEVFSQGLTINEKSEGIAINDFKLRPKQVKGGCILVPVPFSLK